MKYFFLVFFLALTSCISDENLRLQSNSKYQGNYVGNFNGDLSGEIKFNVSDTGNLEGTIYYTTPNISESISGYLNDKSMKGKWIKGNLTGNYEFYKK